MEFHSFYSPPKYIYLIKSRNIQWADMYHTWGVSKCMPNLDGITRRLRECLGCLA
jgi:hypothetical protein